MPEKKISFLHKGVPLFLQTIAWFPTRLAFAFFIHFDVRGQENLKGLSQAIFAVNHTSELDPIILTAALRPMGRFAPMFYVVAPAKEFDDPKFRWRKHIYKTLFFNAWGAHELARGMHDYDKSLAAHLRLLKHGQSLCIFPEGGVTKTGELRDFRGGFIHLARETGVPIVPVAITGAYKMSLRLFFSRKRHVTLEFGAPIHAHQISATAVEQYSDDAARISSSVFSMLERHKAFGYHVSRSTQRNYAIIRWLFGPIVRAIWIRRVVGRENIPTEGPVLIAANHQSYFDFITTIAISPRNIYYLAAEKFFRSPLWRPLMHATGQVEVDRENKDNRAHLSNRVYDLLGAGHAMGIYPEGTRAPSADVMLKGYPGVVRYAYATGTPIVPIGIRGAHEVMSRFDKRPKFKKVIELHIGEPIRFPDPLTSEPSEEHIQEETQKLMRTLAELSGKQYPYGD
ncbi:MAG TPA: lysophospholipid acyltransferase family protein [Candidatus Paceibacterota bacterium]